MRFVAVKSEENQAAAIVFRARDLLVRQRTQIINVLLGRLAEFGIVVAQGPAHVAKLVMAVEDPERLLPDMARPVLGVLVETLRLLDEPETGVVTGNAVLLKRILEAETEVERQRRHNASLLAEQNRMRVNLVQLSKSTTKVK